MGVVVQNLNLFHLAETVNKFLMLLKNVSLNFFFILMVKQGDSKLSTLQKFLHSSPTHSKVMPIFVSKKEIFEKIADFLCKIYIICVRHFFEAIFQITLAPMFFK